MFNKILLNLIFICLSTTLTAGETIDMADTFRSEGKIYVVVTILSIVFAGIVMYLIRLDRKLSRLEKEQSNSEKA